METLTTHWVNGEAESDETSLLPEVTQGGIVDYAIRDWSWFEPQTWQESHPLHAMSPHQLALRKSLMEDRLVCIAAGRQTGKDFSGSEWIIESAFKTPGKNWLIAAPSERQSLLTLSQCKDIWVPAWDMEIESVTESRAGAATEHFMKAVEIVIVNKKLWKPGSPKSTITAVPGRPDTVRGYSANIALTEADFFERPWETWAAMFPMVGNAKRGGLKQAAIWSSPNGKNGLLWKLHEEFWSKLGPHGKLSYRKKLADGEMGEPWTLFKVPLVPEIADGVNVSIKFQRSMCPDADTWAQEYLCEFQDAGGCLFPYELLAKAETPGASMAVDPDFWTAGRSHGVKRVLGVDFGRKRDLTVAVAVEVSGAYRCIKEVLCIENMNSVEQAEMLASRCAWADAVEFDYTGPGIGLGDMLAREHGEWKPEAHKHGKVALNTFTLQWKAEWYGKTRQAFDAGHWGIPGHKELREDLHAVYKTSSPSGVISYHAPHMAHGHSDRAAALVLAEKGASRQGGNPGRLRSFAAAVTGGISGVFSGRRARGQNRAI